MPIPDNPIHKRKTWSIVLTCGVAVISLLVGLWISTGNFWQGDSGIAACKAMADRGRTAAKTSDSPMTRDDYLKLRQVFRDSDVDEIERNGLAFVDITWQVANMKQNDPLLMMYASQIVTSYNTLATACANNGVLLPSLAELTDIRESASPVPSSTN